MALTAFKECKGQVSKSARVCPHCGVKRPAGVSLVMKVLVALLSVIIFNAWIDVAEHHKAAAATPRPASESRADPKPQPVAAIGNGPAASPNGPSTTSSAERRASRFKDWQVCIEAGKQIRAKKPDRAYKDAVLARSQEYGLNGIDLMAAASRTPAIGMSVCGIYATLGAPQRLNRTQRSNGVTAQWVYDSPRRYLYTDTDQIVTAIQD